MTPGARVCELLGLDPTQLSQLTITFGPGDRVEATARFRPTDAAGAVVTALTEQRHKVVPY